VVFDTKANADAASQALSVGSSPARGVTVLRREVREVAASACLSIAPSCLDAALVRRARSRCSALQ
jgi:hypothetical protein